jgi:hypothetical protein
MNEDEKCSQIYRLRELIKIFRTSLLSVYFILMLIDGGVHLNVELFQI